ncbi:zinc finger CCCH domain-containing protein 13-like [Haliotis rufescens]|uniref:zinc finger CCCH domain-containing protein 13-like n=1 Tax=Haliotis rufescens TaxID=6454 RepID=UPI00201F0ACB|nr:zinc finger CCCH domain-containing protein 13-like [Haliotis rufescens]XP_046364699.2 zinc finger CCCH domain-containing protein 13-like [Haliotis rufescens]
MNKVAVPPNSSYRDTSPSKLPHYTPVGMSQKPLNKQPSKLEMLQADFQSKLLREKEEKMIRMYEDQQKRALSKVGQRQNSGNSSTGSPSARQFFQQRRQMEQQGYNSPPIEEHYRMMRRGYSSGGHSSASSHASNSSSRYGKNSAGKDRAHLLQPLDKRTPPVPTKARIARQRPNNTGNAHNNANTMHSPNGQYEVRQDNSRTSSNDSSPPPNLQNLRNFQRKRLGAPPPKRNENEGTQKLTDFQRWQMEQNKAREQRLDRYSQPVGGRSPQGGPWGEGDSTDGDKENQDVQDDLEEKQREIMEEIERHKQELETMRMKKEREEEEARREAELERKMEAERERRHNRQMEEERKKRMQEEERERKEDERLQREEEKMRRNAENKRRQQQQRQRRAPPPKERTPSPEDDYRVPDNNVDFYAQAAADSEAQGEHVHLLPCKMCGRKFAADRLGKHQAACKKANKKRKTFDPAKMRTEGTEMAKYVGNTKTPRKQPKKKDWRAQHESFIETIRYAKKVSEMEAQGVKPQNLPPPPRTVNPDYVRCPTCNRNFNPNTAEKHIPNCRARPRR